MSSPFTTELNQTCESALLKTAAFMPAQWKQVFAALKMLFDEALCWFTVATEMCCRRRFGLRALSLFQVIQLVMFGLMFAIGLGGLHFDPLYSAFNLLAAGLAVYHFYEARKWERGTGAWRHTYAEGDPHPEFWSRLVAVAEKVGLDADKCLTTEKIVRFYEPALVAVVGLLLMPVSWLLGMYLTVSSVALLLKAQIRSQRRVDALRDRNDAMLTGQILSGMRNRLEKNDAVKQFIARVAIPRIGAARISDPEPPPLTPTASHSRRKVRVRCRKCESVLSITCGDTVQVRDCPKCGRKFRIDPSAASAAV
jgi:hypothetical protein